MRLNLFRILTVLAFLFVGDRVVGQPYDVEIPPGIDVNQLNKLLISKKSHKEYVWVAYEGLKPLKSPNDTTPSGAPAFKFLDTVGFVYIGYEPTSKKVQPGQFMLAVSLKLNAAGVFSIDRRLGWVNQRYVLDGTFCLRNSKTRNFRKAIIVNTPDLIEKDFKSLSRVPILKKPVSMKKGKKVPALSSSPQIYFVYQDTHPHSADSGFVLLGSSPIFRDDPENLSVKHTIIGWVPKSRVFLWNSRQAIEYNWQSTRPDSKVRRTKPVEIFETLEQAKRALLEKQPKKNSPIMVEAFRNGRSIPWSHDRIRYPIVGDVQSDGSVKPEFVYRGNRCWKIAVFGGVLSTDGIQENNASKMSKDFRDILGENKLGDILSRNSGFLILRYGYVWEKPITGGGAFTMKQVRTKVLMSEREMTTLFLYFRRLGCLDPFKGGDFKEEVKRLVAAEFGIGQKKSFQDVVFRKVGVTLRSRLLHTPWNELPKAKLYRKELQRIRLAVMKLEDALKEREHEYVQTISKGIVPQMYWKRVGPGKMQPRFFHIGGDKTIHWCWVDQDTELP